VRSHEAAAAARSAEELQAKWPYRAEPAWRGDEPLHLPGREEVERLAPVVRRGAAPSAPSTPTTPSSPSYDETAHAASFGTHATAAEFSEAVVLGRSRSGARTGWRHLVNLLIGGLATLPAGPAEHRQDQYFARVRRPIDGTRRIVVMSRKGGVGKTTITVGVGATFASARGDRVVAVDANPDAGNLARRIAGDCQRTITDLLADAGRVRSFATMRGYTSQCIESRLEVLASDDDARIAQALDRNAYDQVVSLLDHYYNLILLDTGTGILDSANQGLIAQADQLVLVVRPALDGARAGAQTLDWLEEHGHSDLVQSAVVAVNGVDRETDPIVAFSRQHFSQRCSHVSTIPWDRALEAGGRTTLSSLHKRTRAAFVDVAAALADQFGEPARGHRLSAKPPGPQLPDQLEEDELVDDIPAFLQ
jgi:MinD-like ATPase involved in chromosome partitioning or flagellar assembly